MLQTQDRYPVRTECRVPWAIIIAGAIMVFEPGISIPFARMDMHPGKAAAA